MDAAQLAFEASRLLAASYNASTTIALFVMRILLLHM
jgi:hypothetical protein